MNTIDTHVRAVSQALTDLHIAVAGLVAAASAPAVEHAQAAAIASAEKRRERQRGYNHRYQAKQREKLNAEKQAPPVTTAQAVAPVSRTHSAMRRLLQQDAPAPAVTRESSAYISAWNAFGRTPAVPTFRKPVRRPTVVH